MRFGSWIASGPFHFDYLTPRKHYIATTANLLRAGVSHFSIAERGFPKTEAANGALCGGFVPQSYLSPFLSCAAGCRRIQCDEIWSYGSCDAVAEAPLIYDLKTRVPPDYLHRRPDKKAYPAKSTALSLRPMLA
jgi:hypothetical protein